MANSLGVHQFGKYEAVARLASGGAANVFLARRENPLGETPWHVLCLKTLLDKRLEDEDFIAMFVDEAKLGQKLTHPSCVHVEEFGSIDGILFQAMEFVFGLNLWELLGSVPKLRRPLPHTAVAEIIAKACRGLHFAHSLTNENGAPYNLIHRDISPQNIMVTFTGDVKVLDFGVASADTGRSATATGIVKGKFGYMSPEQISGAMIDLRSDIYSMGIILFECLASRRLYKGETPPEIAKLILEHRPPPLQTLVPKIHSELDRICAKALMADPKDRYQTAAELASDLEGYLRQVTHGESLSAAQNTVQERFATDYSDRKASLDELFQGAYNETRLLEAFSARPVMSLDFAPAIGKTEHDIISSLRLPFLLESDGTIDSEPHDREQTESAPSDPLDAIATRIGDDVVVNDAVTMNVPAVRARTVKPLLEPTESEEGVTQLEFIESSVQESEYLPLITDEEDAKLEATRPYVDDTAGKHHSDTEKRFTTNEAVIMTMAGVFVGVIIGLLLGRFVG